MKLPISYNLRNLWRRRLTTSLTVLGVALVVFAFSAVLMLAYGLEKTLVATGSDMNAIVLRRGADTEMLSWIYRERGNVIKTFPEIAPGPDGTPLVTTDLVVIINLLKKGSNDMGNVMIRGTTLNAFPLRPQVKLIKGRVFRPGSTDIIIGKSIMNRFQNCKMGQTIKFGQQNWLIVGIFEAEGTGFESEIWGDVEEMMPIFGRPVYSIMTFRMNNPNDIKSINDKLDKDLRLKQYVAKIEKAYYAEQSAFMANFIRILGLIITIIFSIGSTIGAMITMYTAVANRTKEIGTLRALGFKRKNILTAFLMESLIISIIGGILGLVFASFLQFFSLSTTNFNTFSELAFSFTLSPAIIIYSMLFAIAMGFLGGFLPSVRAARLQIVNALRTA